MKALAPSKWALVLLTCVAVATLASGETFKKHSKWLPVGPNPSAIVAADLNEDELPEIVTADVGAMMSPREERPANDQVSLLVSRGKLSYEAQPPLQAGFAPYCIVVANIDALKAPDLVVGNFLAARQRDITLFRNLRDNLFEPTHFTIPPDRELSYERMRDGDEAPVFTTPGITSLVVQDFNHDGYRDVVATGWSSDVLAFLPGTVDTYFGAPQFTRADGAPRDVKAADFDGDGETDLVATLYAAGEVALWRGDGKGTFTPATHFLSRGRLPQKIQVADINGDGRLDLAVSHCHTDDSIVLFYGDGKFSFSVSQEILLGEDREMLEREIRDILVADLNGDGKPDIAAACHTSSEVIVLINASTGKELPQTFHRETYTYEKARPYSLCAADFDGDGKRDLGVTLWEANSVALLLGK